MQLKALIKVLKCAVGENAKCDGREGGEEAVGEEFNYRYAPAS